VTPPPSNRNLYGASSQSSQGTEVLSQATEVLSNEEDLPPTPHLSQENAGAASATPGASSLKKTNAPGFRGNPLYTNAQHRYMFRPNLNDPSQDYPSDAHGNRVPFNDPRRNASRHVDNVEETIANLSSATPLSRRNMTARAAASAAESDSEPEAEAEVLFSPAASRSSVLSLTPYRQSRPSKNYNSPRRNTNKKNHNRNKIGGKRRTYRTKRKQRKQRKGTQRKRKQSHR
jgi:hypothetical protein